MRERTPSILGRLTRDYGMLGVLLLLCVFFIVVTWSRRDLQGADAAAQVAAEIPAGQRVLVIAGKGDDDAAFADAMVKEATAKGFSIVERVLGAPADARGALERSAGAPRGFDVIAVPSGSRQWPLFDGLEQKFPSLVGVSIRAPRPFVGSVFLTTANLLNIVNQIVVIAVIAIGMTMVIITAGIDLSVGSLIALSAVIVTLLIRDAGGGIEATGGAMILAGSAAVAGCALVGLISGAMVTAFSIPPFIVTLSMMLITSGLASKLAKGESIYALPPSFTWLGRGSTIGLPNAIWLLAVLYVAAHVVMSRTTLGRCIYAIGGNAEAARLSGVPVRRVLLLVYALSAAMAGLGGVVMASQLHAGAPTYGGMFELYVIAAVVVGGTSLMGGEGKVLGTLIGAFVIAVISNGMNLTNVEPYNQKIVLGAVILAAVMLDVMKKRGGLTRLIRWRKR
jgi:ribose transport system permease protein